MKNYKAIIRSDLRISGEAAVPLMTCVQLKSSPAEVAVKLIKVLLEKGILDLEEAAHIVGAARVEEGAQP